jgi:hypothetical protein
LRDKEAERALLAVNSSVKMLIESLEVKERDSNNEE